MFRKPALISILLLLTLLIAATAAAADFWEFDAHYDDGSSLTGAMGNKYGQDCYYELHASCPSIEQPCEAITRMQQLQASVPMCAFVQPPDVEKRVEIQRTRSQD